MSNKQKNIISNFYLIREDNTPVYVGYTNRPVKQRFREHLRDKEFTGNATVEEIDSMAFPFIWDINVINQYANEVSNRETSLIEEYDTGDSIWQKGINGSIGGQTWADVKYFVNTNRDNPKFAGMKESEILAYLDRDSMVKIYMQRFVNHADDPVKIYMSNFVGNINDPVEIYMSNFINHIEDPVELYMKHFVSCIDDPVKIYMQSFVGRIDDPVKIYMKNFVNDVNDPVKIYMKNFVGNIKNKQ